MTKTLFSKYSKQSIRHIMLTSSVFLALASASLTGCGAASASSYKSETVVAYDTSVGMPASLYKSSTGFSNDARLRHTLPPETMKPLRKISPLIPVLQNFLRKPYFLRKSPIRELIRPEPRMKLLLHLSNANCPGNVSMNLETREFDALTKSISDAVTFFGGYMEQADVSGNQPVLVR